MQIRIGIRPSPLALKQVQEARPVLEQIYPGASFVIRKIHTPGDRDKTTPLSQTQGSDFFTKEIDEALLRGEIDAAVHSSKDLPDTLPEGLAVIAETGSISPFDCLVSRGGLKMADLPVAGRIGASSLRRKEEIRALRNDLKIVDIRGNVDERLALLDKGQIDALIVAHAAMMRLGLEQRIAEIFPLDIFRTHPKQGSLTIVGSASASLSISTRRILSERLAVSEVEPSDSEETER